MKSFFSRLLDEFEELVREQYEAAENKGHKPTGIAVSGGVIRNEYFKAEAFQIAQKVFGDENVQFHTVTK